MKCAAFFFEAFAEEEPAIREAMPPGVKLGFSKSTIQETDHLQPPAPLISIRTQSILPDAWLPAIRGVLARTTGYDHLLPLRERAGPGLALACLPEYCSRAVAEHAALLWMALLRKLPRQLSQFASFDRDHLTGGECAGRTLTVVGVGRIGGEVCRIGRGLGMNVLGVDPVRRHADITYLDPAGGLGQSDVTVCAMNLTQENRGYFDFKRLSGMKRGSIFVNVARGELSSAEELLRALDEGILGGVGLDVFNDEAGLAVNMRRGIRNASPEFRAVQALSQRDNVILTPHNAFNTAEALARKSIETAREAAHFIRHGVFLNPLKA